MTSTALQHKINDLSFWLDNNPKTHQNYQQNQNLLSHFKFKLNQKLQLSA